MCEDYEDTGIDYAEIAAESPDYNFEKVVTLRNQLTDKLTYEETLIDIGSSMYHEMVGFDRAVQHVLALDKEVHES